MCGIGGILRTYPAGVPVPPREESIREAWLDILDDSIKHRGPDGCGRFRDRVVRADGTTVDVALIHRRMAIIDLEGGHQPMLLRPEQPGGKRLDDQLAVVFNGCIYNHRELRKELEALGAEFRTDHSDTEVLLWGWRKWGREIFSRLRGMAALILWDANASAFITHVLPPYEKPLFSATWSESCVRAFCSSAGGLIALQAAADEIKFVHHPYEPHSDTFHNLVPWLRRGHNNYLRASHHSEVSTTHFAIDHVPISAGDCATLEDVLRPIVKSGWQWTEVEKRHRVFELPTPDTLNRRVGELVRERLTADVPVGAMLSGGIDSSLIVALARRDLPSIQTFCVRMPVPQFDESMQAADVAKALGVRHQTIEISEQVADDLVQLIELAGLPFADSSLLPTYWAAKVAAKECKVVLTGDGGDEIFYGYERYKAEPYVRALGLIAPLVPWRLLPRGPSKSAREKFSRLMEAAKYDYETLLDIFPWPMLKQLVPAALPLEDFWDERVRSRWEARFYDINETLPSDYLRKVDLATMAVPIESRAPFLDQQFMLDMLPLSAEQAMSGGRLKGLLKDTLKLHLPAELVDRPKMGFAIPLAEWFRTDFGGLRTLLGDLVINATDPYPAEIMGCELNRVFIRELFDQHMSGKRDHAQRLYALLVMAIWCRWYRRISRHQQG